MLQPEHLEFSMNIVTKAGEINVIPIDLLILQVTEFCNLDCKYCYLPNRSSTAAMTPEVLENAIEHAFSLSVQDKPFTIVFHAGEPLLADKSLFLHAIDFARKFASKSVHANFNVQTNGMFIDEEWCRIFQHGPIQVGVSIDGPQAINDANRIDRRGRGSFAKVKAGIDLLRANNINFHAISVLTEVAYQNPRGMYEFFKELSPTGVCFNVDEIDGANAKSTTYSTSETAVRNFWQTISDSWLADGSRVAIRELNALFDYLSRGPSSKARDQFNQTNCPFGIITVAANGDFSTFSPEFMALPVKHGDRFVYGNVLRDRYEDVLNSAKFLNDLSEITLGVNACNTECEYFAICGGGCPSNKYAEAGSMAVSTTKHCHFSKKIVIEEFMRCVENRLENG